MTPTDVVNAVLSWVGDATAIESLYPWLPSGKSEALPDCVADVASVEVVLNDPLRFPMFGLQEVALVVHTVGLSIMVNNEDEHTAADQLRGYCDALLTSLLADGTLGGRVPICSPLMTFDFTRPYVRYQDGTKGREVTAEMAVGVPVEVPA